MNLMKKVLVALLLMVLLSACTPVENNLDNYQNDVIPSEDVGIGIDEQSDNQQIASDNTQVKNMLMAVMVGNEDFLETGLEQKLNIRKLKNAVSSDSTVTVEVKKFSVIDLDADGIDEIALWLSVNGNDDYGCVILRYYDEEIYGYLMWYRAFNSLKEDGTFSFSAGAADSGFGKLKFDGKTCDTEKITYSESDYDTDNEIAVSFFINGEEVAQELFETEIQKQNEKKDSIRYDFTLENIEKYVAIDFFDTTDGQAAERLLNALKETTGAEADSLKMQFFRYYQAHNYELAMMPVFEKGSLPNWGDLTLFALLNNDNRMSVDGIQVLTTESFAQTVTRFFGAVEYRDKSSKYLTFEDGIYTAVPGGTMRNGYFWLKELNVVDGDYTATFDAFYFTDSDYTADYEQATPNQRAVRDYAGTKDSLQPSTFASTMLEILSNEDYASMLNVSKTVTITFSLSHDSKYPLTYTSCSIA